MFGSVACVAEAGRAVTVSRVVEWMASSVRSVPSAECGAVVALVGVDAVLSKCGSVTSVSDPHAVIRPLHIVVSPIVRMAVRPAKASNVAKMADTLRLLTKANGSVEYFVDSESGEHVVVGAGARTPSCASPSKSVSGVASVCWWWRLPLRCVVTFLQASYSWKSC